MPSILDKLRGVLRRPTNTTAQLADALVSARQASADAVAAVEKQAAVVAANFLDTDDKRVRDRAALADLRAAAEDAVLVLAEVERRHDAAVAAEEDGRRRAIYAEAKAKVDAAATALAERYPALCNDVLAMLRQLAEAQLAAAHANEALPDGAMALPDPEVTARALGGQPREVVSDTEVELWSRVDMQTPVDAEYQDAIYALGKGWGRRPEDLDPCYRMRRFRRVEYRESVGPAWMIPLGAGITLPLPRGDGFLLGVPIIQGVPHTIVGSIMSGDAQPANLLARLAAADAAAPAGQSPKAVPSRRETHVEWTNLGDVEPLPVEKPRPDTTSRRDRGGNVRFGASPFAIPARTARR